MLNREAANGDDRGLGPMAATRVNLRQNHRVYKALVTHKLGSIAKLLLVSSVSVSLSKTSTVSFRQRKPI